MKKKISFFIIQEAFIYPLRKVIVLSEFRLSETLKRLNLMVFPVLISTELDLVKTNDQPFEPPSLLRFNLLFLRRKKKHE